MKKKEITASPEPVAQQSLGIRAVYIRKSQLLLDDEFDPLLPGQKLNGKFTCKPDGYAITEIPPGEGRTEVSRSVAFHHQFDFEFLISNEPQSQIDPPNLDSQKKAATLSACISVDYLMPGDQPKPEELEKYAATSMVHAWPYWREYCHSSMLRMQLPVVLAPLLSLVQQKPEPPQPLTGLGSEVM